MLKSLTKFELSYQTRQVGFWISFAAMFLLGLLSMSTDSFTAGEVGERIKANGSLTVASIIGGVSLGIIFFGTVFTVTGAMRDDIHKSLEIIHATKVETSDMIWSRLLGIILTVFLCVLGLLLGAFVGQFMPWVDKESLGPINPIYFLYPLILYGLLNSFIISTLYILIAGMTRNRTLVYISAVGFFVIITIVAALGGIDEYRSLAAMLDPTGGQALDNETRFWPPVEQNTRLIPLSGDVLWNRLLWVGVSCLGLFYAKRKFTRGIVNRKTKTPTSTPLVLGDSLPKIPHVTPALPNGAIGSRLWVRFKHEYFTTVRSIPFAILLLLALSFFTLIFLIRGQLNPQPLLLTSGQIMFLTQGSFNLFLLFMMIFFGGDIIWREQTSKITELVDSTPVSNWILLAGKWLAVIATIYTVLGLMLILALGTQAIFGVGQVKPIAMSGRFYLEMGMTLTFWAILIMFIQNFMPNRIVGMIVGGGALWAVLFGMPKLPFYHSLMSFGNVSPGSFSEMNGYRTGGIISMWRFLIYWLGFAGIMATLSFWLWRRGTEVKLPKRLSGISKQIRWPSALLATVSVIAFLGMGANIFRVTNIENTFYTDKKAEKRLVEIEKTFKALSKTPLPKIRSVNVDVNIYPSRQDARFKGQYVIENTLGKPLTDLWIDMPISHDEDIHLMALAGAKRIEDTELLKKAKELELSMRLYRFEPALPPGGTTTLDFDVYYHPPKFGDGSPINKKANFLNHSRLPQLGIQYVEMRNPDKRRKYNLGLREKRPDRTDKDARNRHFISASSDFVDFKANFCTDAGQIPIAPGKFIRETMPEDGRFCREYEAINPILNFFSFVSAPFETKTDIWENPNGDDVKLTIYYHDDHPFNIDSMMTAMQTSMDVFTETFGPYQYAQARIMEVPYVGFAQAFAGTIPFSENLGFIRDIEEGEDKVDFMTYVTAHELGHQWFAHQIVPADTKGFNVLSEGLTENATMTAYEKIKGYPMTRRMREIRGRDYLSGRASDKNPEPPLALSEEQQYIFYSKASMVFWGLRHLMEPGEMNLALKGFIEDYGSKGAPFPTTVELIDALRDAAPEELQQFITDSWDEITLWESSFGDDIKLTSQSSGKYTVTATLNLAKKYADPDTGEETDAENLDEFVEVGFYKEDPSNSWEETPILIKRLRLTDAKTDVSFEMDEKPGYIVFDPRALLIERKYDDNIRSINTKLASAE
jgi:ABC-type transport system involved in multi-copper enzyme maturation permease subunit